VQDPTNADPRYTRAAVRTQLTPVLNARWPGWQAIVGRHARQAQEAATILDEVAQADFALITTHRGQGSVEAGPKSERESESEHGLGAFSLAAWRTLSAARQRNVLRHWLARLGARMPSDARLANLQRQLMQLHSLGHDRNLTVDHGEFRIRCVRGIVMAEQHATLPTRKKAQSEP
ncbi:MAG: hypothetical protein EON54_08820, partial [Alcaligenaceae bacterium]